MFRKSRMGFAAGALALMSSAAAAGDYTLTCPDAGRAFNTITKKHISTIGRSEAEARRMVAENPAFVKQFVDNLLNNYDPEHLVMTRDDVDALTRVVEENYGRILAQESNCKFMDKFKSAYKSALQGRKAVYPKLEGLSVADMNRRAENLSAVDEENPEYVRIRNGWAADAGEAPERFLSIMAYKYKLLKTQFAGKDVAEETLLRTAYMHTLRAAEQGAVNEIHWGQYPATVLKSLMKSLDPYSDFEPAEPGEANPISLIQTTSYIGLGFNGLWITHEGIMLKVIAPDSPVITAGLKPGDTITGVDGKKLKGLSNKEIVAALRCAGRQKEFDLEVVRGKEGFSRTVKCGTIMREKLREKPTHELAVVKSAAGRNILHITLNGYTQNSFVNLIYDIMAKERMTPVDGYALDVRGNPGGFNIASQDTAATFLRGLYLRGVKANGTPEGDMITNNDIYRDYAYTKPLVVLTDEHSASAAEHTAGSLKDYNRGIIVSEKEQTYGKGTGFEEYVPATEAGLPEDAGYFQLSNSYYYYSSGHSPQIDGVKPDVLVGNDPKPRIPLMRDLPNAISRSAPIESAIKAKWMSDACKAGFLKALDKKEIEEKVGDNDAVLSAGLNILDRWIGSKEPCMFENRTEFQKPWSPFQDGPPR